MTKAQATIGGANISIEGSPAEIANLLERLLGKASSKRTDKERIPKSNVRKLDGPTGKILALKEQNFFKKKRTIADVKAELEKEGHIYPRTSLSPTLLSLVQKRELRRFKEKSAWVYVS